LLVQPAISLNKVSKDFRSSSGRTLPVLSQVSFDVQPGEFVSIIGHSGCGKTTTLRIVSGLLSPTSGEALVDGKRVAKPVNDVGIVFQNPLLMPWLNTLKNVLLPIDLLGKGPKQHVARARELLEVVGLAGVEDLYPRELSGGMQQRVAIARALIHEPSILLMDEPFGSLDELTREEMAMQLLEITERLKKTVVFVTHSIQEAVLLSDRVIVLSPKPSTVKTDLRISLPRPRSISLTTDPEYLQLCQVLRASLGLKVALPGKEAN